MELYLLIYIGLVLLSLVVPVCLLIVGVYEDSLMNEFIDFEL